MDKYSKTIKNLALDLTRIPSVVGIGYGAAAWPH